MRRSGSAAPHKSWSPTVKAERYSAPIFSLRKRPIGMSSVPVTATGVRCLSVSSRRFVSTANRRTNQTARFSRWCSREQPTLS